MDRTGSVEGVVCMGHGNTQLTLPSKRAWTGTAEGAVYVYYGYPKETT